MILRAERVKHCASCELKYSWENKNQGENIGAERADRNETCGFAGADKYLNLLCKKYLIFYERLWMSNC